MTPTTNPTAATTAVEQEVQTRIRESIQGLEQLARLVTERPDIASGVVADLRPVRLNRLLVYVGAHSSENATVPDYMACLGMDAVRHGARVRREQTDRWAALLASFGLFELYIYTDLSNATTQDTTGAALHPVLMQFESAPACVAQESPSV